MSRKEPSQTTLRPTLFLREKELAEVTLASIGEGVIRIDAAGRVDYMNPVAERLTGWELDEGFGCDITEVYQVVNEATRRPRHNPVESCLADRKTQVPHGLFTLKSRSGDEYTVRDTISPLLGEDSELLGAVVVFRDLSQVRTLEREMAYMTSHDALTGLLNRQNFEIYLEAALESARDRGRRNGEGGPHALLHLDLVELKLVNDCYGHLAGDELLRQVAELLKRALGDEGVIGRVGGGDFALLAENRSLPEGEDLARRIQRSFADFRFQWGGQRFEVGFHIGVASLDADCPNVTFALRAADNAAYKARQRGRHKIHVHDPTRDSLGDHHGRLHWMQRLRVALAEDRFVLYHQRIEPMASGRRLHEILVRMVGDSGEHIAPGRFIPVAEEHDLAPLLDRWVMRRSFELLGHGALAEEAVSLNLSAQSLGDESFLDDLLKLVRSSDVDPRRIYFEITETHAVASLGRALRFISALEEVGCRFILDDFGSGFSSFGYLKNLPVDVLKIDGQFVREVDEDPVARAMVASITEIAHLMNLTTIAEHVETDAHLETVREIGVDYVQGFRLHRPEPIPGQ